MISEIITYVFTFWVIASQISVLHFLQWFLKQKTRQRREILKLSMVSSKTCQHQKCSQGILVKEDKNIGNSWWTDANVFSFLDPPVKHEFNVNRFVTLSLRFQNRLYNVTEAQLSSNQKDKVQQSSWNKPNFARISRCGDSL